MPTPLQILARQRRKKFGQGCVCASAILLIIAIISSPNTHEEQSLERRIGWKQEAFDESTKKYANAKQILDECQIDDIKPVYQKYYNEAFDDLQLAENNLIFAKSELAAAHARRMARTGFICALAIISLALSIAMAVYLWLNPIQSHGQST